MILTALRLHNFRQFRGSHELQFSTDPKRNVTVVMGANGAGKTGLFLALNWGLYGEGTAAGRLLSKGIESSENGFVEVHFRHEGTQYVARRALPVPGQRGGGHTTLNLVELSRGRSEEVANPVQRMNEILPSNVRTYFFFDGERIDEMTKPGHEDQVKDAIRSVLKLKVLERAIAHLTAVERDVSKTLRSGADSDREVGEIANEMESVRDALEGLSTKNAESSKDLEEVNRELSEHVERLKAIEGVREILLEEAKVDAALANLESRADDDHAVLAEIVGRSGPVFARGAIDAASKVLDEKRRRGEIPSNIKQTLIDDLLSAGVCICDRHLDDDARAALDRRRQGATSSAMEEVVLGLTTTITGVRQTAESVPARMKETLGRWSDEVKQLEDLQRKRDGLRTQVEEELRGQSADAIGRDVKELEGARHRLETRVGDLRFELGQIEAQTRHFEGEFSRLSQQLKLVKTRSTGATLEKRRYELAVAGRQAAEKLLIRFAEEMRQRIEKETDRIFKSMIWKKKAFDRVKILEDYRLDVVDRFGASAHHELSAGEREVLSLAFIVAMSEVTGEEAPLVIDTPFGRLSKEPLDNIVKSLPGLVHQLVLLVTDDELNDSARSKLMNAVGQEYVLDYDDRNGTTGLRVGGANG